MYLIKLSRNDSDGNSFSGIPQLYKIESKEQIRELSKLNFLNEIKHKNVLVLLYGLNLPMDDILPFYMAVEREFERNLLKYYDTLIGFIWPDIQAKFSYHPSNQNKLKVSSVFQEWIHLFNKVQCTVDVLSRSTGSILIYHSAQKDTSFSIRNIFSIGAGIPHEIITNDIHFLQVINQVENIYVFYASDNSSVDENFNKDKNQKVSGYPNLTYWEERLTLTDKIKLINISDQISLDSGYKSLTIVAELMDDLLSGCQQPKNFTKLKL